MKESSTKITRYTSAMSLCHSRLVIITFRRCKTSQGKKKKQLFQRPKLVRLFLFRNFGKWARCIPTNQGGCLEIKLWRRLYMVIPRCAQQGSWVLPNATLRLWTCNSIKTALPFTTPFLKLKKSNFSKAFLSSSTFLKLK